MGMMPQEENNQPKTGALTRAVNWLWRLFSSVKLAIILILVLTGVGLIGAFVVQVPKVMGINPSAYATWVSQVGTAQVGVWSPLFKVLGFFNIFHGGFSWFNVAGGLLIINILVCSLNRWPNIKLSLQGGSVKRPEEFFTIGKDGSRAEIVSIPVSGSEAGKLSENVLRRRNYRVMTITEGENTYIAADKNRWLRLGTYLSHFSLILFVLGFILTAAMGWNITSTPVNVGGDPWIVGNNTNLTVKLNSFNIEYYTNGTVKDYLSNVTLFDSGQQVKQAVVSVNHPLVYNGVHFYQSSYGTSTNVQLQVNDVTTSTTNPTAPPVISDSVFDGTVTLGPMGTDMMSGYNFGTFQLPEQNLTVYIISSTNPDDPYIPQGDIDVEFTDASGNAVGTSPNLLPDNTPTVINGLQFTYSDGSTSQYSIFQVSRDPTNSLIWIASILFILGICMVLYFPYRQTWILLQRKDGENSRVLIRTIAPRSFNNRGEIESLSRDIKKNFPQ